MVKLEKHADMLIADHVKRSGAAPPPGSYSWQWIDYSVKNGFLQPQEDYQIEEVPARAAGASAPAKGRRVKFTKEDDDILAKFVLEHERQGGKIKGNVIFEELDRQVSPVLDTSGHFEIHAYGFLAVSKPAYTTVLEGSVGQICLESPTSKCASRDPTARCQNWGFLWT